MIKRVLGWIFAIVAIATVVFAALNWGGYTSMCFNKGVESSEVSENKIEEPAVEPLNVEEELVDSSGATESTL